MPQIINEGMLEDVNNILNSGDVPNLYGPEEMDKIMTACRPICAKKRIPATKLNVFAQVHVGDRPLYLARNHRVCFFATTIARSYERPHRVSHCNHPALRINRVRQLQLAVAAYDILKTTKNSWNFV